MAWEGYIVHPLGLRGGLGEGVKEREGERERGGERERTEMGMRSLVR